MSDGAEIELRLSTLMRAAQAGDKVSYARLLEALSPILRRFIRRRRPFLQPTDIEDLLQDILLSLHSVRASYDPERPFTAWLFGLTKNRIADGARRYGRRKTNEASFIRESETFFHDPTNSEEEYGDADALKTAIQSLPRVQREAIEMLKLRELSLKEASSESGMSVAALKVAVHRAIKSLRNSMPRNS
jgi:RNA polymerase sigma factor (sigma-70 family)